MLYVSILELQMYHTSSGCILVLLPQDSNWLPKHVLVIRNYYIIICVYIHLYFVYICAKCWFYYKKYVSLQGMNVKMFTTAYNMKHKRKKWW